MGIIIAKFRKKKSTYDVLEKLENEIISIEEFSRTTENTKKRIVGRFIVLAISSYIFLVLGLYFYYHRISPNQKLIYTFPLIAIPIVVYVVKCFLTWYFSRKIRRNQSKLVKLKEEKKKLLEKVEETETYKVAKKILDKFGDSNKIPNVEISDLSPAIRSKSTTLIGSTVKPVLPGLRQRTIGPPAAKGRLSFGSQDTNSPAILDNISRVASPALPLRALAGYSATPNVIHNAPSTSSALQLPRAILPKNRTVLDKMFDYLVGDGPSNRYALICKNCFNHNGMAFKEEFEYLAFKCCYCGFFNPSRKKRPSGPKFEPTASSRNLTSHSSDSDVSSAESEELSRPIITEPRTDSPDSNEKNSDFDKLSDAEVRDMVETGSPEEGISSRNNSKSSPTDIDTVGEAGSSRLEEIANPFETSRNPFETDAKPSTIGKNPFGDGDSDHEISCTPMDFETVDDSNVVSQDGDVVKSQETKED